MWLASCGKVQGLCLLEAPDSQDSPITRNDWAQNVNAKVKKANTQQVNKCVRSFQQLLRTWKNKQANEIQHWVDRKEGSLDRQWVEAGEARIPTLPVSLSPWIYSPTSLSGPTIHNNMLL